MTPSPTGRLSDHCHRCLRSVRNTKGVPDRLSTRSTTSPLKDTRASDEHVGTVIVSTDVRYGRQGQSRLDYHRCVIFFINHGTFFIAALAFAFIERPLNSPQKDVAVARATLLLESTIPMLEKAGFQRLVFEDFYEVLLSLIQQIVIPEPGGTTLTPETLLEAFQIPEGENFSIIPRVK